ncbi:hypothetical protein [Kocuria sp. BT304]|uniref:hypothetical protein n=1 Tax=Kocuria sp. BT304 TaxID=1702043 RepID=UPI000DD38002|nr:hypothetical protein [Kocuria sp. BT304]
MSTPPENGDGTTPDCPWTTHPATGEHERISPPAPMIELDTPHQEQPVKPLGPRRLARLQREMAEHAQQVQEAERRTGGAEVDDALLATQRRLAELAVRAAAANEQDRRDADRAVAAQPDGPGAQSEGPGAPGDGAAGDDRPTPPPAQSEYVTITFPGAAAGAGGGVELGARLADPASLPASAVHYGPVTETTSIPVLAPHPARVASSTGTSAPAEDAPAHGTGGQPRSAAAPETSHPVTESRGTTSDPAPASPVRAVDAEGLDLLEPRAYTRVASGTRVLLALLLVVIAALAVVLIMFIL